MLFLASRQNRLTRKAVNYTSLPPMKLLLVLAAFPTFVRQVHAQQSPFVMPPFSLSTPAAAALFLTLLVSDVAATLPDFEVVGNGACLDGSSPRNRYDYILFLNGYGAVVTSKDDCARLCVPCACEVTNRQFRGFGYVPTLASANDEPACACFFDDDPSAFTGSECQNMNAGKCNPESRFRNGYVSYRSGTGVIDSSSSDTDAECLRTVTTFSTEDCPIIKEDCPSEVPSESPVIAPSESPSESPVIAPSESPSDAPVIAPSESPSDAPVIAPSESPSDTPSKSASPTAKASKHPKGPKSSKMPKASSLQTQAMKSGGAPSFSPLCAVGVCGTFAVIMFMFIDLI